MSIMEKARLTATNLGRDSRHNNIDAGATKNFLNQVKRLKQT